MHYYEEVVEVVSHRRKSMQQIAHTIDLKESEASNDKNKDTARAALNMSEEESGVNHYLVKER